ncbi:MAG: hypothetical protein S4CHLAM37_04230 [Chlamydiia bacterium]|nr:hypothetical protein [Chlamydiia bacterium]
MSSVPEIADLALNSIGLFSAPEQVFPPVNNSYFFEVNHNLDVSQAEINNFLFKMRTDIGKERNKTFTSLQERKIFNFSIATLSGIGAFACASTAIGTAMVGMIVLSAVCVYSTIQFCLSFREYDLDKPVVRNAVLDVIGDWSFREVLSHFTVDKIVRYDLFETKLLGLTDEMRCAFYANLANLYLDKFDLDTAKDADLLEVTRCYTEGTKHITSWVNGCRSNRTSIEWGRYERDHANLSSEDETLRKINRLMELKIEGKYRELMAPWDIWKSREVSNIDDAYKNALNGFDSVYNRILNGKGNFQATAAPVNIIVEA